MFQFSKREAEWKRLIQIGKIPEVKENNSEFRLFMFKTWLMNYMTLGKY